MSETFTHRGPWDTHSRQSPPLKFLEKYILALDSLDLEPIKSSSFYAPLAIFHDTNGDVRVSGPQIWEWQMRRARPFLQMRHEVVELRTITEEKQKFTKVYGQFLTHFLLRGDEEEIVAPRFFIWTLGESEGGGGTEGLQIQELSLFWDTGILGRHVTKRNQRAV